MKRGDPVALRGAARGLPPLLAVVALSFVRADAPGSGLACGALIGVSFFIYALVFGAGAARRAMPDGVWRLFASAAAVAAAVAVCAPDWAYAALLGEAAAACASAAACGLSFLALAARAPTLRDADW